MEQASVVPVQSQGLGWGPPVRLGLCAWVWGGQCSTEGPGLGGPISDSLGFTLQGRQKPLCVQALTSSSTSHPTPPGPFKKKKNPPLGSWGGSKGSGRSWEGDSVCS